MPTYLVRFDPGGKTVLRIEANSREEAKRKLFDLLPWGRLPGAVIEEVDDDSTEP